jgi:hypothetical protein
VILTIYNSHSSTVQLLIVKFALGVNFVLKSQIVKVAQLVAVFQDVSAHHQYVSIAYLKFAAVILLAVVAVQVSISA